jgi:hypothetical protein
LDVEPKIHYQHPRVFTEFLSFLFPYELFL